MTLSAANHDNRPATLRQSVSKAQPCRVRFASTPEHEPAQQDAVRSSGALSLMQHQKQHMRTCTPRTVDVLQVVPPYTLLSLRHGSQADRGGKQSMEDVVLLVDDVESAVGHAIPGPDIKAFFAVRWLALAPNGIPNNNNWLTI